MMQLDEMARQASTDVKLAVMDLEAPPIGAATKNTRKASAGWAKPLLAMAALFLIAGTSWALLGGNRDVEETQIADLDTDQADVVLLTHPDAVAETVTPFPTSAQLEATGEEQTLETLVFGDSRSGKGYMVTMFAVDESVTADIFEGSTSEVRGLPAILDEGGPGVAWAVSDTLVAEATTMTLTSEELLDELENPNVLEGTPVEGSPYRYIGNSTLGYGPSVDVIGYGVQFGFEPTDLDGAFELTIFAGSLETERGLYEMVMGIDLADRQIRDGKQAYVPDFGSQQTNSDAILWEESPGVVALLVEHSADVSLDELVQIAEELTTVEAGGSATVVPLVHPADVDQSVEALKPLGPDGEDVEVLVFSADVSDATADGFMLASIRFAEPFTAEEIAEGFPGTEVRGLPTGSGEDEQGTFAIWLESADHLVRSGSQTMTVEELLLELQYPGLLERTVADDSSFAFVGSSRFFPDAPEDSSGLTGFTTTFGVPETGLEGVTFQVTTFVGSLENELAVAFYRTGAAPAEVVIRPGVPGYLFPGSEADSVLPQLMWEESPGVVAALHQYYGDFDTVAGEDLIGVAAQLTLGASATNVGALDRSVEQLEAEGAVVHLVRRFDSPDLGDIFFETNGEICVINVGLGTDTSCFPLIETRGRADYQAFYIRSVGDDVEGGESGFLLIDPYGESPVDMDSQDELLRAFSDAGPEIVVGSTDAGLEEIKIYSLAPRSPDELPVRATVRVIAIAPLPSSMEEEIIAEESRGVAEAQATPAEAVSARQDQLDSEGVEVFATTDGGILYACADGEGDLCVEVFNGNTPTEISPELYRHSIADLDSGTLFLEAYLMDPPGDLFSGNNTYANVVLILASPDIDHLNIGGDFAGERQLVSAVLSDVEFKYHFDIGYGWQESQRVNGRNAARERITVARLEVPPRPSDA